MATLKQIESARRNGAKSRGPKTPEGKARSSRNALTHGLESNVILLDNEDPAGLERVRQTYTDLWQPATPAELDLVNDIVAARWRLNRAQALEAASLNLEMTRRREEVDAEFESMDPIGRAALAFHSLNDRGRGFGMLSRHEGRLLRVISRATADLRHLQAARAKSSFAQTPSAPIAPAATTEKCGNEPDSGNPLQ